MAGPITGPKLCGAWCSQLRLNEWQLRVLRTSENQAVGAAGSRGCDNLGTGGEGKWVPMEGLGKGGQGHNRPCTLHVAKAALSQSPPPKPRALKPSLQLHGGRRDQP